MALALIDDSWVLDRIETLRQENMDAQPDKWRIRAIMNGGSDGMLAVMAWDLGKQASSESSADIAHAYGTDLPTVNLMASGNERLAQAVGRQPTLKPPKGGEEKTRTRHEKRVAIVRHWDECQSLELHYPQVGRWLPGYGYAVWKIRQRMDHNGEPYPMAELTDPYDCWPGWFGPNQQPSDVATSRVVPLYALQRAYPDQPWADYAKQIQNQRRQPLGGNTRQTGDYRTRSWEGKHSGIEVVEYICAEGTYICVPEVQAAMTYIPNPLETGPPFVFVKRFSFDALKSHYHHAIGLMAMMAKLNILNLIATEDSVFRETNISGEMISGTYERGRFAVNLFEPGARVEKPVGDIVNQPWGQVDRLERQLRIQANYDVQQDAISPNSFATGRGMEQLQGAANANVREYQTALRYAVQALDAKRLEWMDRLHSSRRTKYYDLAGEESWFRPSRDIKGDYRTRRVYGAMATWDDTSKVILGIQMQQAGVLDRETLQENIDGLENLGLVNERIDAAKAEETLFARLAMESEQNPAANAALIEIMDDPSRKTEILKKYFTPQEPQMSPEEEMAMAAMQQQAGGGEALGPPPPVATMMSRIETGRRAEAGIQTAGRIG